MATIKAEPQKRICNVAHDCNETGYQTRSLIFSDTETI